MTSNSNPPEIETQQEPSSIPIGLETKKYPNLLGTGITGFDALLGGGLCFPPNQEQGLLVFIRGRPGTGKTTLGGQIYINTMINLILFQKNRNRQDVIKKQDFVFLRDELIKMSNVCIRWSCEHDDISFHQQLSRMLATDLIQSVRIGRRIQGPKNSWWNILFGQPNSWVRWKDLSKRFSLFGLAACLYGMSKKEISESSSIEILMTESQYEMTQENAFKEYIGINNKEFIGIDNYHALNESQLYKYRIEAQKKELEDLTNLLKKEVEAFAKKTSAVMGQKSSAMLEGPFQKDPVSDVLQVIQSANMKTELLILDGLSVLNNDDRQRIGWTHMLRMLRKKTKLSIIVYERESQNDVFLDHEVDVVICLRGQQHQMQDRSGYYMHEICIEKSRYQSSALGWHQYKIRAWGLEVMPSIHFNMHRPQTSDNQFLKSMYSIQSNPDSEMRKGYVPIKSADISIVDALLDGIAPGTTTALFGTRGTFKTLLSIDFLVASANNNMGKGLIVSLIDDVETIRDLMKETKIDKNSSGEGGATDQDPNFEKSVCCPRRLNGCNITDQLKCKKCVDKIFLYHQNPGCVSAAEILYNIKERIEVENLETNSQINRLVFWDITQIDHRFPLLREERLFLPALMDLSNKYRISTLFIGAANSLYSNTVSAMADNVIFAKRISMKSKGSKNLEEKLLLHVDRVQGQTGHHEMKKTFMLSINDRDGSLKFPFFQNEKIQLEKCHDKSTTIREKNGKKMTGSVVEEIDVNKAQKERIVCSLKPLPPSVIKDNIDIRNWIQSIASLQDITI